MIVNNANGIMAIRKGDWKYIEGEAATPLNKNQKKHFAKELEKQLYNLKSDITESNNLIVNNESLSQEMQSALDKIRELGSERKYSTEEKNK
jgi:hypothetical protein